MKKGDLIKLTKISDDKFRGHHPNQINKGFNITGQALNDIVVGDALFLNTSGDKRYGYFHTSVIIEILGKDSFKTLNSTYKVEILESAKPSND